MLSASKITEGESAKPGKSADNIMVDEYSSTIKCKKCEQSKFDREGLTIRITQYQKINGSIFEKNYVVFCIQVDLLDYTITRRFSDFEWFRETLKIQFPGQPIPPIAHKGKMKIK
jgi:sorting nexin-7/30/sorting nexin-8